MMFQTKALSLAYSATTQIPYLTDWYQHHYNNWSLSTTFPWWWIVSSVLVSQPQRQTQTSRQTNTETERQTHFSHSVLTREISKLCPLFAKEYPDIDKHHPRPATWQSHNTTYLTSLPATARYVPLWSNVRDFTCNTFLWSVMANDHWLSRC